MFKPTSLGQTLKHVQPMLYPAKADIAGKPASQQSRESRHARSSAVRIFGAVVDDMRSKTDQIRSAWAAGDQIGALRIAAQFFDRSTATKTFQRGMNANNHPDFYRQLGKEPQEVMTAALALLAKRFDLR